MVLGTAFVSSRCIVYLCLIFLICFLNECVLDVNVYKPGCVLFAVNLTYSG